MMMLLFVNAPNYLFHPDSLGVLGSFPLIMFNYMGPIMISYLVFPHFPLWGDDSFVKISYTQFRPWLGRWMTVASVVSNFGALFYSIFCYFNSLGIVFIFSFFFFPVS
jgi:hypothetical protein